jgi:hypothetical protein
MVMWGARWGVRHLIVVVLFAAAAAACAPTQPAATPRAGPTPSPPPSPGVLQSVAFSLRIPSGWSDMTSNSQIVSAVHPDGNLLVLLEGPPPEPVVRGANDLAGVIAVTEPKQPIASSDVAEYLRSVVANGATALTSPAPEIVSKTTATSVTYQSTFDGTPTEIKDVMVAHGGAMYEIELITSLVEFPSQEVTFDELLSGGWSWMSGD